MTGLDLQSPKSRRGMKSVAILTAVFGVATLFSEAGVLFAPPQAQILAGNYIPFVVWFTTLATVLTTFAFGYQVRQGASFDISTVGAPTLRFGLWACDRTGDGPARRTS